MCASKDGDVHGDADRVRLVETYTEVALTAQQQQDKHANVHQPNTRCRKYK